jgi:hypothetical protein
MKIKQLLQLHEDVKDMENIAFGDLQQADEKDTAWEAKVFHALQQFVSGATPENKISADAILKDVHALKAKYPKELMPDSTRAYRGTQLTKSHYEKFLSTVDPDLIDIESGYDETIYVGDMMYSPQSPIQSWTTREAIADRFATGRFYLGSDWQDDRPYPAIIKAAVDDSFVISAHITNKIAKYNNIDHEHEIIRTSGTPIKCKIYVLASWLHHVRELSV